MTDRTITRVSVVNNHFLTHLTLLFIGLKLTGYIDWSWLWVLTPLFVTFLVTCISIYKEAH